MIWGKYMFIVDMHCDTVTELYQKKKEGSGESLRTNCLQLDLMRMKKAEYVLQNFAIFINTAKSKNPYQDCLDNIEFFRKEIKSNQDLISQISTYKELRSNLEQNKMSAMLTIEDGAVLMGNVDKLHEFYNLGVRMLTLTWNYPNELGYPNTDLIPYLQGKVDKPEICIPDKEHGLTETGIYIVEEMQKLGMIIDVSHASDKVFYDVLEYTRKPFVASHSNARAQCLNNRNLTDDMIRNLAERGGIMGINLCAPFIKENEEKICKMEDIIRHIKHIKNVGGVEVIGLGCDLDGINNELELQDAGGMQMLCERLHYNGFTMNEIEKITHTNVLRLYKELLPSC